MEDRNYEAPRIEDHGDLTEMTAMKVGKTFLDGSFKAGANVITDPVTTNP